MKKTNLKTILLAAVAVFGLGVCAQAQTFAPRGATWHYDYISYGLFGFVKIESVGDTTIAVDNQQVQFKVIAKTRTYYDQFDSTTYTHFLGKEFVCSDSDRVYIYRMGRLFTLYDFSANIGDEWEIPGTPITCDDSIGSVYLYAKGDTLINGETLRYIQLKPKEGTEVWVSDTMILASAWKLGGRIVERIGNIEGYMFPVPNIVGGNYYGGCNDVETDEGAGFRCYSDSETFLSLPYLSDCELLPNDISDIKAVTFSTFPNPAEDKVMLEAGETILSVEVYNSLGQCVLRDSRGGNSLYVSSLAKGLYIIKAETPNGVFFGKMLKQ